MYWSVMLLALSFGPAVGTSEVASNSQNSFDSYTRAWHAARDAQRPMLVILNPASSVDGAAAIDGEKLRTNERIDSLLENYVVAVIDTGTEHGREVNELFGSKPLPRLVVIDKEQRLQLYGVSGEISDSRLEQVLNQYRDGQAVRTTTVPSIGSMIPGDCPNCRRTWQF